MASAYPLQVPEVTLDHVQAEDFVARHSDMKPSEISGALRALDMGDAPAFTWQVLGRVWATLTWVPLDRDERTGNGYKVGVEIRT